MYNFRYLDSFYNVDIILKHPDFTQTHYHSREYVEARSEKESGRYIFRLEGQRNILLNREPPQEVMDKLMIELGNAVYPLSLVVSQEGEILTVKNFLSVKEQWERKTEAILKEQYTQPLEQYIRIASRNLKQETALRKSLVKKTFIRLFFLPFNTEMFTLKFENFPLRGDLVVFRCEPEQAPTNENTRRYSASLLFPATYQGEGHIRYVHSEAGDLLTTEGQFTITDPDGNTSEKQILIQTNEEDRHVSGKKNFRSTPLLE